MHLTFVCVKSALNPYKYIRVREAITRTRNETNSKHQRHNDDDGDNYADVRDTAAMYMYLYCILNGRRAHAVNCKHFVGHTSTAIFIAYWSRYVCPTTRVCAYEIYI